MKDLRKYNMKEVKAWCAKKGLKPGRVKGTKGMVYFTKGHADRIEILDWDTFEKYLQEKRLAVYGTKEGWMKIFKKDPL